MIVESGSTGRSQRFLVFMFVAVLLGCTNTVAKDPESSPADALIGALALRESATPARAHPRWAPAERIVVVVPKFFLAAAPDMLDRLARVAGEAEIVTVDSSQTTPADFTGADVIIGACAPGLARSAELRWVHSYAVGVEKCVPAFRAMASPPMLTNGQRLTGPNIAEHTIAMMMALKANLHRFYAQQLEQEWRPNLPGVGLKREVAGSTMLVVGLGGIGTEVARRAAGLGMRVIATRNSSRQGPDFVDYVGLSNELTELAGEADVIVNALPLTPATENLFDAEFFAAAKRGALFISVGRGRSTDHDALVAALASGQIGGAGLDVTEPEPLPADSPLWQMPNVIITPHTSGWPSVEAIRRIAILLEENLRRYVAGDALLNVVDIERGY